MGKNVTASAYLVVKAKRNTYGVSDQETGLRPVEQLGRITELRQNRPVSVGRDEVLVKVSVRLPAAVFDPITPAALIVVPEDMVLERHQLDAEVTGARSES